MGKFDKDRELDIALLKAHEQEDYTALIDLYLQAGKAREEIGDIDAACFYYTHSYVFALEAGDKRAGDLLTALARYGREPAIDN